MTRDDIIRMALEAGGCTPEWDDFWEFHQDALERFAAIVAAREREACAKLFDGEVWAYDYREIAAAIRARGET